MAETCMNCGRQDLHERIATFVVERDDQVGEIQDRQTVCRHCGQVSYNGEQISIHERAVAAKLREMAGLLSADELKSIRLKYRLRQADLEKMLFVGPKSWVRWERGKVVQSKAVDTLVRQIAADPSIAHRLIQDAGIENAEAEAVFQDFHDRVLQRAVEVLEHRFGMVSGVDYRSVAGDVIRAVHSEEEEAPRRKVA